LRAQVLENDKPVINRYSQVKAMESIAIRIRIYPILFDFFGPGKTMVRAMTFRLKNRIPFKNIKVIIVFCSGVSMVWTKIDS